MVLDIIFRDGSVIAANPGGSMLNTAISLGRAGNRVEFIGEIAMDPAGDSIIRFLLVNRVGTNYIRRYSEGKTTLALAFLDEKAEASYSFYSDLPKEQLKGILPEPGPNDIVLFGSFFSLTDSIHDKISKFLKTARQNQAMIIYDPNFRKPHLADLPQVLPRILANISLADVIRGSDEDFLHIFAEKEARNVFDRFPDRDSKTLVYTRSGKDVSIHTGNRIFSYTVPLIKPLSTIGAGDSFNAGLIHGFISSGFSRDNICELTEIEWEKIAMMAVEFAQAVCLSFDNYISEEFVSTQGE